MFKFLKELIFKWSGETPKTTIIKFKDGTFGVKRGEYFAEYLDSAVTGFSSGHSSEVIYKYCRFKTLLAAETALSYYIQQEKHDKMIKTFDDTEEVVKKL